MPHALTRPLALALLLCAPAASALAAPAAKPAKAAAKGAKAEEASKTIKRLLGAIRYQKDDLALTAFDGEAQGALIFGEEWAKQPAEERARFVKALHSFFALVAFPNIRKDFEHLETILYGDPAPLQGGAQAGAQAGALEGAVKVRATIVVLHALKKEEVPVDFMLRADAAGEWRINDFWIAPTEEGAESFLGRLKREQLAPLLEKRGWAGVLEAMERRVEELKKR